MAIHPSPSAMCIAWSQEGAQLWAMASFSRSNHAQIEFFHYFSFQGGMSEPQGVQGPHSAARGGGWDAGAGPTPASAPSSPGREQAVMMLVLPSFPIIFHSLFKAVKNPQQNATQFERWRKETSWPLLRRKHGKFSQLEELISSKQTTPILRFPGADAGDSSWVCRGTVFAIWSEKKNTGWLSSSELLEFVFSCDLSLLSQLPPD